MTDKLQPGTSASASASSSISTSSGAKDAHAEARVGPAVEYRVVDQSWSPNEPAITETMLAEMGQQGWRLSTAYPDPLREKTRWIFSR